MHLVLGLVGETTVGYLIEVLRNLIFIVILCIAATPLPKKLYYKFYTAGKGARIAVSVCCAAVLVLCTGYLVDSSYNPFLYFRF